jgi:integrase/recombinase XerD
MESVMLEHYFVKPSTIDKIRASWLGPQIERYVEWMEVHGYARPTVLRRVPLLFHFAEFLQNRGCTEIASASVFVEEFVTLWLCQHASEAKTAASLRKHRIFNESALLQMLRLACEGHVRRNRHSRSFPLESAAPGFAEYLRCERGFKEATIYTYRRHLSAFAEYLSRAGVASFSELSPPLLAAFIVEGAPVMAPRTRRDLCGHLRVLLRFCHRQGITNRDLSGAVGMSQVYRLDDVPRSITWDEVRRMLDASCAARKRLAPATISKPSEFGRTVMGWMRPCCRMLSASS